MKKMLFIPKKTRTKWCKNWIVFFGMKLAPIGARTVFIFLFYFLMTPSAFAMVNRLISNFGDDGAGTLRWALDGACADSDDDVIRFAPTSRFEIRIPLRSPLVIPSGCVGAVTILGRDDVETILDGSALSGAAGTLIVRSWGNRIEGITFLGNSGGAGLLIEDSENTIHNNFFGVRRQTRMNQGNQVGIHVVSDWNMIEGNTITGNHGNGILLSGSANTLRGNRIGDWSTHCPEPAFLSGSSEGSELWVREISHESPGSELTGPRLPRATPTHCGNGGTGIFITGSRNLIGGNFSANSSGMEENRIYYNGDRGIVVTAQAQRNQFARNSIAYNRGKGIEVENGAQNGILPLESFEAIPEEMEMVEGRYRHVLAIRGVPGTEVDLYLVASDEADDSGGKGEGAKYLESFRVTEAMFNYDLVRNDVFPGSRISSIVCDSGINCSEFSMNANLGRDADHDLLADAIEDLNGDLLIAREETDSLNMDTEGDGLFDSLEDQNLNGRVDAGETDPRKVDTDADGVSDFIETGGDGRYDASEGDTNPLTPDTDGDGRSDGMEDVNRNGLIELGESDPRE